MKTHKLKTWPSFFAAVLSGEKTFEVRQNDRDFAVGDILVLEEWDPSCASAWGVRSGYTGKTLQRHIVYLLRGGEFGIEKGYCVMGFHAATTPESNFGRWAETHTYEFQKLIEAVDATLERAVAPELVEARKRLEEWYPRLEAK